MLMGPLQAVMLKKLSRRRDAVLKSLEELRNDHARSPLTNTQTQTQTDTHTRGMHVNARVQMRAHKMSERKACCPDVRRRSRTETPKYWTSSRPQRRTPTSASASAMRSKRLLPLSKRMLSDWTPSSAKGKKIMPVYVCVCVCVCACVCVCMCV
jgi:hypothetical protein